MTLETQLNRRNETQQERRGDVSLSVPISTNPVSWLVAAREALNSVTGALNDEETEAIAAQCFVSEKTALEAQRADLRVEGGLELHSADVKVHDPERSTFSTPFVIQENVSERKRIEVGKKGNRFGWRPSGNQAGNLTRGERGEVIAGQAGSVMGTSVPTVGNLPSWSEPLPQGADRFESYSNEVPSAINIVPQGIVPEKQLQAESEKVCQEVTCRPKADQAFERDIQTSRDEVKNLQEAMEAPNTLVSQTAQAKTKLLKRLYEEVPLLDMGCTTELPSSSRVLSETEDFWKRQQRLSAGKKKALEAMGYGLEQEKVAAFLRQLLPEQKAKLNEGALSVEDFAEKKTAKSGLTQEEFIAFCHAAGAVPVSTTEVTHTSFEQANLQVQEACFERRQRALERIDSEQNESVRLVEQLCDQ